MFIGNRNTVKAGGRRYKVQGTRFIAAWRKEEVVASRHRQEKREATRLGKLLSYTGSVEFCEATPIGLVDESKESCTSARPA